MSARRTWRRTAAALVAVAIAGVAAAGAVAAFGTTSASAGNVFEQAPDWVAPVTGGSVVAKAAGGTPGDISQGGAFHVYAAVTDAGNPSSGVAAPGPFDRAANAVDLSAVTEPGPADREF
jgi:hypothetical protein